MCAFCIPCASPGTPPPDPLQTPRISPPRACPVINLVAIAFFSITYELPNLQALCFDIHTKCRGCGGTAPVLVSQQLCLFTSANLCVLGVSALSLFRSLPPVTIHESQVTAFKLFGGAEFFSISVTAHEQKSALLY